MSGEYAMRKIILTMVPTDQYVVLQKLHDPSEQELMTLDSTVAKDTKSEQTAQTAHWTSHF